MHTESFLVGGSIQQVLAIPVTIMIIAINILSLVRTTKTKPELKACLTMGISLAPRSLPRLPLGEQ